MFKLKLLSLPCGFGFPRLFCLAGLFGSDSVSLFAVWNSLNCTILAVILGIDTRLVTDSGSTDMASVSIVCLTTRISPTILSSRASPWTLSLDGHFLYIGLSFPDSGDRDKWGFEYSNQERWESRDGDVTWVTPRHAPYDAVDVAFAIDDSSSSTGFLLAFSAISKT